jgi:hypothetical protein
MLLRVEINEYSGALKTRLTFFSFTWWKGVWIMREKSACASSAHRLNPAPGTQAGKYFTTARFRKSKVKLIEPHGQRTSRKEIYQPSARLQCFRGVRLDLVCKANVVSVCRLSIGKMGNQLLGNASTKSISIR